VVSHVTAGRLWQLDGVRDASSRPEVTIPRRCDRRSSLVIVHRTLSLPRSDRDRVEGIVVTSVTRTLVDLAASLGPSELELAVEDAFRRGLTTPVRLRHRFAQLEGRGRPGSQRLRALLDARGSRPSTGSAAEVRLEQLMVKIGLPRPVRQYRIKHDGRAIRVDFAYPDRRLAVEYDGLRWHTGRARIENDAERRNLLRDAGWSLVTITATMMRDRGRAAAAALKRAYESCPWGENVR